MACYCSSFSSLFLSPSLSFFFSLKKKIENRKKKQKRDKRKSGAIKVLDIQFEWEPNGQVMDTLFFFLSFSPSFFFLSLGQKEGVLLREKERRRGERERETC